MARCAWRIDPPSFAGEDTRRGEAPHLPEGVGNVVEIDLGGGRRVRLLPWRRTPNSLAESSPGSCVPPGCGGVPVRRLVVPLSPCRRVCYQPPIYHAGGMGSARPGAARKVGRASWRGREWVEREGRAV